MIASAFLLLVVGTIGGTVFLLRDKTDAAIATYFGAAAVGIGLMTLAWSMAVHTLEDLMGKRAALMGERAELMADVRLNRLDARLEQIVELLTAQLEAQPASRSPVVESAEPDEANVERADTGGTPPLPPR